MIRSFIQKDLQYVIEAHIRIYRDEYNYDDSFAVFISDAVQTFAHTGDFTREMLWIVELNHRPYGSIGLTRVNDSTAQLRWFLLEPEARGAGWGRRLIEHVIAYATQRGYRSILLWTNQSLLDARKLYELYGFEIKEIRTQLLSGQELTEERWELDLAGMK
ncbi:GNAT family N-acetyltransferase [Paenibacillus silvae]|uniref:GNAT family N-acetyltransferase n=1 Tax=Paenibacillus silvae TaxID=1325358 RepID=UPI002003A6DC|nr:GNAT family N-acetyltransferase [Paenibacillus silvae]MCK6074536.1 GNAT family N-acetyltransferase [Paenibacillus silvae]MCK6147988.1 GNAT family N-acetyltransferase [Paenibacillus silvae]MCK6266286.1 GNAT family N-acetyltransferase [Paenibacillus silvae]